MHESDGGKYIKQVGGGPAKGIAQIEKFTFHDHYDYMKVNKNWRQWGLTRQAIKSRFMVSKEPNHDELLFNNALSIAICRVHYLRSPHSLPPYDNLDAIARYWANHYNKGDNISEKIKEFKKDYKHFVNN